ncbi:MAG: hypothetical protein CL776_00310 [Chloroflexi bacterium]|nr:hypothetical protein [Chloroflexota bacterium]MBT18150.1 hypothetical protein [Dehalococcoidia bacterium]|tara:strand:- start:4172 stop:5104 length:933 start_codon:yes stop_codon:yes gene_type:complete
MIDKTGKWQAMTAITIAVVVLAVIFFTSWLAFNFDNGLGHGPLPTGVSSGNAHIASLLIALAGLISGGVTLVGLKQSKIIIPKFAWIVYVLVCVPLLIILLMPLRRYGFDTFAGLPEFLLVMPSRMIMACCLGSLLLGGFDMRRLPGLGIGEDKSASPDGQPVRGVPGRFTPSAWRALSQMQVQAKKFEHAYMGTEHLLLAIAYEERSQATRALVNLGVEITGLISQIEGVIGRRGSLYTGSTGMTRRVQRVIEQASKMTTAEEKLVSTGQLLLAILGSSEDVASQLLEKQNITESRLSTELGHLGPETD